MVDLVTELPLPGRTLRTATDIDRAVPARVTLSAFVAGPENRLVASAVGRLLDSAHTRTTPAVLVICGASGTGKTHLARGLVRAQQERAGIDRGGLHGEHIAVAEYFTAADFRRALYGAIKTHTVREFRHRIRGLELLAIDDVDGLPRDEYVQQELRATLDAYEESSGMILLTTSRPAGGLRNLPVDVRSRLAGGLELRLAPPEAEARAQLARQLSAALGRPLSLAAAERLAAGVSGTAGDIFAAVWAVRVAGEQTDRDDLAVVEDYLTGRALRRPAMHDILRAVAKYYRLPQKVLKSASRRQSAVAARAMAVYLARELVGLSYTRIGQALGGRDHTTIMHNYHKIADILPRDAATRAALADLKNNLRQAS